MFSEKYGYKAEKTIQTECISDTLRQRIWNFFYQSEIKKGGLSSKRLGQALTGEPTIEEKISDRFGLSVKNTGTGNTVEGKLELKVLRFFSWYEVYDFIELHLMYTDNDERVNLVTQYNDLLEQEKSGYRIVANEVAPITNKNEIEAIEQAANTDYLSVNQHIQKAVSLYADKNSPDYENSIKESISAVEAMCCIINGKNTTLNKAIEKLKDKGVHIHPAMEKAFISLYGYTSDESGIRHGGIDFTNAPAEDAKYMLVSCSAFVNYLIEKWRKVN